MSRNKSYELSHDLIFKRYTLSLWINRCCVNEIPVSQQVHDIMIPKNITLKDFSRSRIMDMWSLRILYVCSNISDHRVSNIFRCPIRIFFCRWRIFTSYGVFESCLFKRLLPIINSLFDVLSPFFRCCSIDIVNDRFHRFNKFSAYVSIPIFGFQSPSCYIAFLCSFLFICTVIDLLK